MLILVLKLHRHLCAPPVDSGFKPFDFLKARQEVFQYHDLLIQFRSTSSQRHLCPDIQFLFIILFRAISIFRQRFRKQAHGATKHFRHRFLAFQLEEVATQRCVIDIVSLPFWRQRMKRNAKGHHHQDDINPLPFLHEGNIACIETSPPYY